jgi:23S rRNA G2445 N2-methylase RlmL
MASTLAARVNDSGYTPGVRDLTKLLDLLASGDDDVALATERAILRIEAHYVGRVLNETLNRATLATRPAKGRLVRLLGRLARSTDADATVAARTWLCEALADSDPKTRHAAARALAHLRPAEAKGREALEATLLKAWERGDEADRRALAHALANVGSQAARASLVHHGSAQQAPYATRAALFIDRAASREQPGCVDVNRSFESALPVRFRTREGLERIVAQELPAQFEPRVVAPGIVDALLKGPLSQATAIRTALRTSFPLPPAKVRGDLAQTIVETLVSSASLAILRTFTKREQERIRVRFAWASGGHRRALAFRCAELLSRQSDEVINDPTASTWEVRVEDSGENVELELVPRAFVDTRFTYRRATVPASSHPSVAAALVRMVKPRPDDIVWDPFMGAGAELIERAKLGAYLSLIGSDVDARAIEAARINMHAAGIENAQLELKDATTFAPTGVTVIVTNPPMGRRVLRGTHAELLDGFVRHAANVLVPNGVLVWASPNPHRFRQCARAAGLTLEQAFDVDMGGFSAEWSVHRKGSARP